MRCPYCGGINSDQMAYCMHCGRDLRPQQPYRPAPNQPPPYQQQRQGSSAQGRPTAMPQAPQQSQQAPATQRRRAPVMPLENRPVLTQLEAPVAAPAPPPEPPAPFPPRTVAQLQALEQGALGYAVVNSAVGDGRKKIVRIVYPKGVTWQQVATLFKAFKEQQEERFDTIIIQGVLEQDTLAYAFTNGQLVFDRKVRLGDLTTNRYQIETGNGFESDSIRIVLTE
jgi:hypothetical protein